MSNYRGMSRIIWAMKQLNYTDGLVRLAKLEQRAADSIKSSTANKELVSTSVKFLKLVVDEDLPV